MSRLYYDEVPGGIFHVTSRGNARQPIFAEASDYRAFLDELKWTMRRHRWRCLSYCLMPNHFHLIIQTTEATLAEGMRDLKSGYARSFNFRMGRDGHLFKDGFWRQLIQDNAYLLAAAIYVAKNPVRAGLVDYPGEWPWSSFSATVNDEESIVDPRPIFALLSGDLATARRDFNELAHAINGLPEHDPTLPIVGDEAFVRRHAPQERPGKGVHKRAWEQARPSLEQIALDRTEIEFVRCARREHRYTLGEIAKHLECSEQTVRRRLGVSGGGLRPL